MQIQIPDIDQFVYPEGEEWLIAHLLQNIKVDDITSVVESSLFKNQFFAGLYNVCYEYITTTGKGNLHFQSVLAVLHSMGKAKEETITYLNHLYALDTRQAPSLDYIIEQLTDLSSRRRLIFSLYTKMNRALDGTTDIKKVIADTEEDLSLLQQGTSKGVEVFLAKDVPERRKAGLMERRDTNSVYTYWDGFDAKLSEGFAPGKMTIIAGRTSMGKSFFKTNLIINMANNGIGVMNVCPEQGFDSEHDRIDAIMTGIHLKVFSKIKNVPIGDPKFEKIKLQQERISTQWNYSCVPTRTITVAGVRSAIRRTKRSGVKVNVVFIDLFDRLDDVNVAKEKTANISRKLMEIERIGDEEKVHIVLLVQVGRATESRKDHRPAMSDLRDCGNYEQDADNIFLLYREGYYNKEIEDNILDVEVVKQRGGNAGWVYQFMIVDKEILAIAPIGEKKFEMQPQGNS